MRAEAYIIAGAVVIVGVALFFWRNRSGGQTAIKNAEPPAEIYLGLREKMLSITPAEMGVTAKNDEVIAYGVLMDLGIDAGTATIVSLATGDTSMYTSRGGGIIGGVGHESCRNASKKFISVAQSFVQQMQKAPDHTLPVSGNARFYVLTTAGLLICEERIAMLDHRNSPYSPLFAAGNEVITQIRLTAPDYPDRKR